jgi:hypothetical protein
MARFVPPAPHAQPRERSKTAARDEFYSKVFTRLSIAVFLTMAASVVAATVMFNQGF